MSSSQRSTVHHRKTGSDAWRDRPRGQRSGQEWITWAEPAGIVKEKSVRASHDGASSFMWWTETCVCDGWTGQNVTKATSPFPWVETKHTRWCIFWKWFVQGHKRPECSLKFKETDEKLQRRAAGRRSQLHRRWQYWREELQPVEDGEASKWSGSVQTPAAETPRVPNPTCDVTRGRDGCRPGQRPARDWLPVARWTASWTCSLAVFKPTTL